MHYHFLLETTFQGSILGSFQTGRTNVSVLGFGPYAEEHFVDFQRGSSISTYDTTNTTSLLILNVVEHGFTFPEIPVDCFSFSVLLYFFDYLPAIFELEIRWNVS